MNFKACKDIIHADPKMHYLVAGIHESCSGYDAVVTVCYRLGIEVPKPDEPAEQVYRRLYFALRAHRALLHPTLGMV